MERKPWPIVILAFLHLSEPAFKILFYSLYWGRTPHYILGSTSLQNPYVLFMFFIACPVAGIAIYAVKKWSLPVFILIEALIIYGHYHNHQAAPGAFSTALFLSMCLLNLLVVSYFLIPAVKLAYIDPKFRWWEAKPRYKVDWKAKTTQDSLNFTANIVNISEGGVLLNAPSPQLDSEKPVLMVFQTTDEMLTFDVLSLKGNIAHYYEHSGIFRYGIRFDLSNPADKSKLKTCIKKLEKNGVERRPSRDSFSSLFEWSYTLLTTGQGLLPSLKPPAKTVKEEPEIRKAS